ncbi:MAG: hypothetical protein ABFS56_35270 [Pseudomonadota bacterium]
MKKDSSVKRSNGAQRRSFELSPHELTQILTERHELSIALINRLNVLRAI